MQEIKQQQSPLTFNDDGTIDPVQLEGMPQEFIDRVTAPEFQRIAAGQIRQAKMRAASIELHKQKAREIRDKAAQEHRERRPDGLSGRQRKRLRKLARKMPLLPSRHENS